MSNPHEKTWCTRVKVPTLRKKKKRNASKSQRAL